MVTRYPVVGVSAGIIPGGALLDGQNSQGLSMSANFLPGFTQYQTVTPQDRNYQSILTFGSWALGSFETVAELREAVKTMKVWADDSLPTGPTPATLHFVFVDRGGAGMVVEYVGGEVKIHDNVAHVLTNAPTYDWHLNNVRNYLSLSTVGVPERQIGTVNVTELGQGGGLIGLPGDYTPPSRFVRATVLRHTATTPKNAAEGAQVVAHILNNVDIPVGVAQSRTPDGKLVSDYTQWVAVKDLTNNRLMIADYNNRPELSDHRSQPGLRRRQADGEADQRSALSEGGRWIRGVSSGNQRGGVVGLGHAAGSTSSARRPPSGAVPSVKLPP